MEGAHTQVPQTVGGMRQLEAAATLVGKGRKRFPVMSGIMADRNKFEAHFNIYTKIMKSMCRDGNYDDLGSVHVDTICLTLRPVA